MRPHVCHACKRGGQEHGPYFEADWHYADPRTGSECRLYVCRGCFANYLNAPGSPFAEALVAAQAAQLDAETERDLADAAALELREALGQAQERLRFLESIGQPADGDGLAERLAAALEERWGTPPASWRERTGSRA